MGIYINKGNEVFADIRNDEYIDKSGMIAEINNTLHTERRFSCVTRCRRFGKSMAANMLCAYYDHSCDSRELFKGLEIENDPSFEKHLNQYNVVYLDVTDFTTKFSGNKEIVKLLQRTVMNDILAEYPDVQESELDDLMDILVKVYDRDQRKFILIIDEWDAIMREFDGTEAANDYVSMLRRLFKGSESKRIFAGAYITGILPIQKYNTESALNNFREYSIIKPGKFASYLGFTKSEVKEICLKHNLSFEQMTQWYDGYHIGSEKSMFNPYSVMEVAYREEFRSYWSTTGAYDKISTYIQMNYDGLKDAIIRMLSGEKCYVNTKEFTNDLKDIRSKDDVLTVLIHLGYLSYDQETEECSVPNKEVRGELEGAVKLTSWRGVVRMIEQSRELLNATLQGDAQAVAQGIDQAHDENTSILSYNNENSLSCVISMAYIFARNNYVFHREYATGKGYADIVLIPHKHIQSPALVIELKYDKTVGTAIEQIKRKQYPDKLSEYTGEVLLVGIKYNRATKTHTCEIEQIVK